MNIEWFRDLAVAILGFGATAVIIFIGILAFLLYRKIGPILNSVRATTRMIENVSSCVEEEVAKPLAQLIALIQGIRQAFNLFSRFSRGKEGGRND